jgi:excisionase family DNA binding protein
MADQEGRFESVEEVAERLLVDVQTVRRWIKSGKLKAYKPGREYRILSSDLDEFLEARSSPKVQAPLPESPQQSSIPEALSSYMRRRTQSLQAELEDKNSPHFENATAATNWIADIRNESRDWANWICEEGASLMPQRGGITEPDTLRDTFSDVWQIAGHLMTFYEITRRAERRIKSMPSKPDELSQKRFERAEREAQESERRVQGLHAASG